MRSLTSIILFFFLQLVALPQPCLPDGITFTSQAQIDSFQINYPNCTEIEGDLHIGIRDAGNNISNLHGLSVLTSIGGDLDIGDYPAGVAYLSNLHGLDGLTHIYGDLSIAYNDSLTSLSGLDNLLLVGKDLIIGSNNALTSLSGLDNLLLIGDGVKIHHNNALTCLMALEGINSIVGGLSIRSNYSLTSLSGLQNITSIGSYFVVLGNKTMTSLSGLESLNSIGNKFDISFNDSLTSLSGLENLTSIGGYLFIYANNALISLDGLDNVEASSITYLSLFANECLSSCAVESICAYLASPNGEISIYDNAIGCNSPEEVLDSCEANAVLVDEKYMLDECYFSPNPFTTSTTLSFRLGKPENVHFIVYNLQSQIVYSMQERQEKGEQKVQWNAEGLPPGMYYFTISDNSGRIGSGKLLKY